jgi:DNA-binding response OmpR family regulator
VITAAVSTTGNAEELFEALTLAGALPVSVGVESDGAEWSVALVDLRSEPLRQLREAKRIHEDVGCPVVVLIDSTQATLLANEPWIADFLTEPLDTLELQARLNRVAGPMGESDSLTYKSLELNLATYQATIDGTPMDLTYMEYELLRYFIEHQGRVWSREQLLAKVWGYDYFGGARTVDVHVRRLRAKLGGERASWITTVRSVGYRFG